LRPLFDDGALEASVVTRDYASISISTARRRCRFSAARSPPQGASPNMRYAHFRAFFRIWAGLDAALRHCLAATSRAAIWRPTGAAFA